jgi:hypothetical protein
MRPRCKLRFHPRVLSLNRQRRHRPLSLRNPSSTARRSPVGIFIAAGHDNEFFDNRVVSSGRLPDGRAFKNHFTGIYVWDCCYKHVPRGIFYNNRAYNNTIGYVGITENGQAVRDDSYLVHCAKNPNGTSRCTGNMSLPNPITLETERNEYRSWLEKLRVAKIKVGP